MTLEAAIISFSEDNNHHFKSQTNLNILKNDVKNYLESILKLSIRIKKHVKSPKLCCKFINEALESKDEEILFGYNDRTNIEYKEIGMIGNKKILTSWEQPVNINDIYNISKEDIPTDTIFKFEWLSVEGEQCNQIERDSKKIVDPSEIKWKNEKDLECKSGNRDISYFVDLKYQNIFTN